MEKIPRLPTILFRLGISHRRLQHCLYLVVTTVHFRKENKVSNEKRVKKKGKKKAFIIRYGVISSLMRSGMVVTASHLSGNIVWPSAGGLLHRQRSRPSFNKERMKQIPGTCHDTHTPKHFWFVHNPDSDRLYYYGGPGPTVDTKTLHVSLFSLTMFQG